MAEAHEILLPPERPGHACPPDLAERRAGIAAGKAAGVWNVTPPPGEVTLGGRRTLVYRPEGPERGRLIHYHGGAYRLGCPEMTGPFAAAIAARTGYKVFVPEYRLAPEHPFPCGLNDGWAALEMLSRAHDDGLPLVLCGDSAGGGMATALTVMAVARGLPVAGLIALSPWLDLTVSAPSYAANAATDPLFSAESAESGARLYTQGGDRAHPLASPLFADLRGFPRTFTSVGSGEVLLDDARHFHRRLTETGIDATLSEVPGMDHTAVVRSADAPGSPETLALIVAMLSDIATARG
ncbi:MAG: alpha/beta hydrolase [Sphingomonadales bacterium]|nr:alpha/beta hydrolase [Sphingomonadales bacterium]